MSYEVNVQFEVRSLRIMKETLQDMKIAYKEVNPGILSIDRRYHNIVINSNDGTVSLDSDNRAEVDKITQTYQVNWYKEKLIKEGRQFTETLTAEGVVELHVHN